MYIYCLFRLAAPGAGPDEQKCNNTSYCSSSSKMQTGKMCRYACKLFTGEKEGICAEYKINICGLLLWLSIYSNLDLTMAKQIGWMRLWLTTFSSSYRSWSGGGSLSDWNRLHTNYVRLLLHVIDTYILKPKITFKGKNSGLRAIIHRIFNISVMCVRVEYPQRIT